MKLIRLKKQLLKQLKYNLKTYEMFYEINYDENEILFREDIICTHDDYSNTDYYNKIGVPVLNNDGVISFLAYRFNNNFYDAFTNRKIIFKNNNQTYDDYLESILNYVDKNVFPINLKEASLYLDMIKKNNDINFINDISYKTIVTDNEDMYKYDKPDEYYNAKLKRLGCSWINNVKE